MHRLIEYYKEQTGSDEVDMKEVAKFAVKSGWPLPEPVDPYDRLAKQFTDVAREVVRYDQKTGKEIEMTGKYDEMTERSYPNYTGGTEQQRKMRDLLRSKMEAQGFTVYEYEWWHFDYKDWKSYRITNEPFSKIH